MQCLIYGSLGLHLSGLLCTPCLVLLGGIPLVFNGRVGNIACAGLDWSTGCALLAVQISICCCCCLSHDGAMHIARSIVCLQNGVLLLDQVHCHLQSIDFQQQLLNAVGR
jgi:hypothetical protein